MNPVEFVEVAIVCVALGISVAMAVTWQARRPRLGKDALDDYFGQYESRAPEPDPCTHSDWCRIQRSFHRDASLWMEQDQRISEWLSKKITAAFKAEKRAA